MACKDYFIDGTWMDETTLKNRLKDGLLQQLVNDGYVTGLTEFVPAKKTAKDKEIADAIDVLTNVDETPVEKTVEKPKEEVKVESKPKTTPKKATPTVQETTEQPTKPVKEIDLGEKFVDDKKISHEVTEYDPTNKTFKTKDQRKFERNFIIRENKKTGTFYANEVGAKGVPAMIELPNYNPTPQAKENKRNVQFSEGKPSDAAKEISDKIAYKPSEMIGEWSKDRLHGFTQGREGGFIKEKDGDDFVYYTSLKQKMEDLVKHGLMTEQEVKDINDFLEKKDKQRKDNNTEALKKKVVAGLSSNGGTYSMIIPPVWKLIPKDIRDSFKDALAGLIARGVVNAQDAVYQVKERVLDAFLNANAKDITDQDRQDLKEYLDRIAEALQKVQDTKSKRGTGIKLSENVTFDGENVIQQKGEKIDIDKLKEESVKYAQENTDKVTALVDELVRNPRPLTPSEVIQISALKVIKELEIKQKYEELKGLDENSVQGKEKLLELEESLKKLDHTLMNLAWASIETGYQQGLALALRKLLIDEGFNFYTEAAKARQLKGEALNEYEEGEIRKRAQEFEELEAELDRVNSELEALRNKEKVQNLIDEATSEKGTGSSTGKKTKSKAEPKYVDGKLQIPRGYVMNFIDAGVTDADVLFEEIKKDLDEKEIPAEIKDITNAISQYGFESHKDQAQRDQDFARIKAIALLLSKINDVKQGKEPLTRKTNKREISQREIDLRQELVDLMRKFGLRETTEEAALRNAINAKLREFDKLSKRIENDDYVDAEVKDKFDKTNKEYQDADAKLKAKKKEFNEKAKQNPEWIKSQEAKDEQRKTKQLESHVRKLQGILDRYSTGDLSAIGVTKRTEPVLTPEQQEIKKQADALKEEIQKLRDEAGITDATKLEVAKKRMRAAKTKAEKELQNLKTLGKETIIGKDKDLKGEDKDPAFLTKEEGSALLQVEEAIDNGTYEKAIAEGRINIGDVVEILNSHDITVKGNLDKIYKEALKGFTPTKEQKRQVELDEEARQLKIDKEEIRLEQQKYLRKIEMAQLKGFKKYWKVTSDILQLPRAAQTFAELSFIGVQGAIVMGSSPFNILFNRNKLKADWSAVGKSFELMYATKSKNLDRAFHAETAKVHENPLYKIAKKNGIRFQEDSAEMEEAFAGNIINKVPIIGENLFSVKGTSAGLRLPKRSEYTYSVFMNQIRMNLFEHYYKTVSSTLPEGSAFWNTEEGKKNLEGMAKMINTITGSGNLGALESASGVLSGFLYSARFLVSKVALTTPVALIHYAKAPKYAKKIMREQMGAFAATQLMLAGIQVAYIASVTAGDEDEEEGTKKKYGELKIGNDKLSYSLDPRSPDFMTAKVNGKTYDVTGGMNQGVKLSAQLYTAVKFDKDGYPISFLDPNSKTSRLELLTDFFTNKAAPITGWAFKRLDRTWDIKEETTGELALNMLTPFYFQTLKDSWGKEMETEDIEGQSRLNSLLTMGLDLGLSTFGTGIRVPKDIEKKTKEELHTQRIKAHKENDLSLMPREDVLKDKNQNNPKPKKTYEEKMAEKRRSAEVRKSLEENLGIKQKFRGGGSSKKFGGGFGNSSFGKSGFGKSSF
jgi:hypothetical protein